jgi:hypothetical protein
MLFLNTIENNFKLWRTIFSSVIGMGGIKILTGGKKSKKGSKLICG